MPETSERYIEPIDSALSMSSGMPPRSEREPFSSYPSDGCESAIPDFRAEPRLWIDGEKSLL